MNTRPFLAAIISLWLASPLAAQDVINPQTNATQLTTGTLPAGRLPALTGDVTSSAGSAATTLAAGSASNLNSGTLAAARMPAFGSGDVSFATAGGAGTIAANAVTLAKLATQATNTVLGNATSGTAVPTALAVGTCSTAASALIWTTNTGFGCNTSITASAVAVGGITGLGTGVGTALAIAVGSAGGPVTNGGALGSPASAGTLPAHTLGGTISGGGNQINNVIIGTTTPLAGTFTTLTANTSVTVGAGTGTPTAIINGANSGTGGGSYVSAQNAGSGVAAFGNKSAIIGGAYDATGMFWSSGTSVILTANNSALLTLTTTGMTIVGSVANSSQTSAMCFNSGTGAVTYNSGVTTCLASTARVKDLDRPLTPDEGLNIVMAMEPWLYSNKDDSGLALGPQMGFVAEKVAVIEPRLAAVDADGRPNGMRYEQYTAALTAAFQAQQKEIQELTAEVRRLSGR